MNWRDNQNKRLSELNILKPNLKKIIVCSCGARYDLLKWSLCPSCREKRNLGKAPGMSKAAVKDLLTLRYGRF